MDTDRWAKVESLFHAALDLPAADRLNFVRDACAGDDELRHEVESLLEQDATAPGVIDRPAWQGAESLLTLSAPAADRGGGPFAAGQLVISRFRIERVIASGGMGVVYLATDLKLNEPRALKAARVGFHAYLSPEARSSLSVTHPHVCRVFEIHTAPTEQGPVDFLSMEYVEGGTLAQRLQEKGPLDEKTALRAAQQICAALTASHDVNLLHRDLKPSNVLLTADGDCKVTDFGLAETASTKQSAVAGTLPYLAPERLAGQPATVAVDVFALGVMLHEMIAGTRPQGEPGQPKVIDAQVPPRWKRVIGRCLAADPAERYQTAASVAEALSGRAERRRNFLLAGIAAVVLASAAWWQLHPPPKPARLAILPLEAPGADVKTASVVRAVSYDLSNRMSHVRPKPPQLVVIPVEETTGIDQAKARQSLGASHVLRGSLVRVGDHWHLHGSIVDTATQVVMRETETDLGSAEPAAARLGALVAAEFNLPRPKGAEEINAAAYPDYLEGMTHLRGKIFSFPQAVPAFERAIAKDPRSPLPPAALAEACYQEWRSTGDPQLLERGKKELARAAALNPDVLSVHLVAGKLNLAPGNTEEAEQEFLRAVQLDPESAEAWRGLAQTYERTQGRRNDAASAYLKAIALQPDYVLPLNDFANFQRRLGNYEMAEEYWKKALAVAPDSADMHMNLGGLYVEMGRWQDAERELKRSIQIQGDDRFTLNSLGALLQYLHRDAEAAEVFERTRKLGPESHILALNLGDSYRRLGKTKLAAEAYSRGRKIAETRLQDNPGDAAMRGYVAYFALRLGERERAEREISQALHFGAKDKVVIRRAVLCFEAMRQRPRTLALLETAPPDLIRELSRQPDLYDLRQDARFQAMLPPPMSPADKK